MFVIRLLQQIAVLFSYFRADYWILFKIQPALWPHLNHNTKEAINFLFISFQGRQKLALFNAQEFATLIIDILHDARRRQQESNPDLTEGT